MPSRQRIKRNKSKKVGKYLTCNKKNYTFASLLQDSLAQLVEHNTFNVGVLGSNPKRITTIKIEGISETRFPFLLYNDFMRQYVGFRGISQMLNPATNEKLREIK
jgi:hypothetical protein